ncbi:MAG TPA: FAD-dependent oxidoreductase [Dongiaceae bacterium]|nr:FAD-dependent oxidoreductase [Dongiaceae bacterium]
MRGETDILIIGGGLAGTATAYFLARAGAEVTLVERSDLNTQASGSNAGSIHAQIPHEPFMIEGEDWARIFAPTIPLMLASIRLWQGLEAELGADLEFHLGGGLLVGESEAQLRDIERKARLERAQGLQVELLDAGELRRRAPYLSERMIGGAYCPTEGKANPLKVTPAFAAAARRHGAEIIAHCPVTALTKEADFYRAETGLGAIRARRVVNAAGAEAGQISAMLGLALPIQGHPIQVNVTEPAAPLVEHLVYFAGEKLTLKQAANGSFLIGGGWPARWSQRGIGLWGKRPAVDLDSLRANLATAQRVVPALASVRLLRVWPAIVNGTADWKPILGEVPGLPGFFVNMFPWMGFTAGPISALITSELVLGQKPSMDIAAFSALRHVA